MALANCPRCPRITEVPDCLTLGYLRCPGCEQLFKYQSADLAALALPATPSAALSSDENLLAILKEAPQEAPEPGPPPVPTQAVPASRAMIAPHICQHCMGQIKAPINKKAATINCPRCRLKTSVYAIQFRCPHCTEQLECPKRLGGQSRDCTRCTRPIAIPKLVLDSENDEADDLEAFLCECPSCNRRVVARRDEVGRPAICPQCEIIITVPAYGNLQRTPTRGPLEEDPREVQQVDRKVACRACGLHIPADVEKCPICGNPNQVSKYP